MNSSKRKRLLISRAIFLRYIPILTILVIDIFSLALLDMIFVLKKKERIFYDSEAEFEKLLEIIHPLQRRLSTLNSQYQDSLKYTNAAKKYLDQEAPKIIQGDHPWFWIILKNEDNEIVAEYRNDSKMYRFNTWNNCLFSRSFHAPVGRLDIRLTVYYATPKGWPQIEAMVQQYRIYALIFVLLTWLVYFWLHQKVFRPFLRVGSAIEQMIQSDRVTLIGKPSHDVEKAFNHLARNQREVYFGLEVDRIVDSLHALADNGEVVHRFLRIVPEAVKRIYPLHQADSFQYNRDKQQLIPINNNNSIEKDLIPFSEKSEALRFQDSNTLLVSLFIGGQLIGLIRLSFTPSKESVQEERYAIGNEIKRQIEYGLARAFTRSQTLTEERNRFGINLATNMGHDLTNIIASGKWDLDTIQRSLDMGIVQMDSERGHFFQDAVEGLKNNLHFLQEMVNIYRSVGYTRKPQYERTHLHELLDEVVTLFQLSTSKNLTIHTHLDESEPIYLEPRLLRMGLFNLLNNASQAIQQSEPVHREGEIGVRLQEKDSNSFIIMVSDNGPGIRNSEGKLMPEMEIDRIFQSGFSTKKGSSGGGLGLSWVKSIIEDFHGGRIQAFNRKEGGACFSITISKNIQEENKNESSK